MHSICGEKIQVFLFTLPGFMHSKTAGLRDLVKTLGILVIVTPQNAAHASGYADAPSEILTASCRQNGLAEAYDNGFEED